METHWTRGALLRRAATSGTGALLLGAGAGPARLVEAAFGATEPSKTHLFRTRPDLVPPVVSTVHHDPRTSDGYLFLAPLSGPGQRGSLILDKGGEPVWFRPSKPVVALNFRAAVYRGKPGTQRRRTSCRSFRKTRGHAHSRGTRHVLHQGSRVERLRGGKRE